MEQTPITEILGVTMEKIKTMANADTVIGDPIKIDDKTTAIPVSKVSYGFASGGSDIPSKTAPSNMFGGGGGAGMSITPIAFLVVSDGNVKVVNLSVGDNTADKVVAMVPEMFDKIVALFKKDKNKTEENNK